MRYVKELLCSVVLTLPIAALARAPYTPPAAGEATLRLAWRMNVKAGESCRQRTAEELAALPAHMRTPEVCTRDVASYVLVSRVDDAAPDTLHLLRGGVKGDRPLFVLEDRALPPGRRRIRVEVQRSARARAEVLASLDTVLVLRRGAILLITLDEAGRLVPVSAAAR